MYLPNRNVDSVVHITVVIYFLFAMHHITPFILNCRNWITKGPHNVSMLNEAHAHGRPPGLLKLFS